MENHQVKFAFTYFYEALFLMRRQNVDNVYIYNPAGVMLFQPIKPHEIKVFVKPSGGFLKL